MAYYKVAFSKRLSDMVGQCNDLVAEGYTPVGGMSATNSEFFQAMFKADEPQKQGRGRGPAKKKEEVDVPKEGD